MSRKSGRKKRYSGGGKASVRSRGSMSQNDNRCDSKTCDAILVARSQGESEDEMKRGAKDALGQALQEEELHLKEMRGEFFVPNDRGLGLAGLPALLRAVEERFISVQEEIVTMRREMVSREQTFTNEITELRVLSHGYLLVRDRFIATFRRDKLNRRNRRDTKVIAKGNITAHGGDATVDATLYSIPGGPVRRQDAGTFVQLYGLHPHLVSEIKHQPTIAVLNTHAGVIASGLKKGSPEFYNSFNRFITSLKFSEYDQRYLDNGEHPDLTSAYWAFVKCPKYDDDKVPAVFTDIKDIAGRFSAWSKIASPNLPRRPTQQRDGKSSAIFQYP
ncbi:unnamed protein product [Tuber aestivum]|uniref:Uncharacterized protein n=1 Tax=Tuber aestivum TaxID=59557 RepID=A0A292Q9T9_9PEZI|nr:unnamed protein product [Tuber aestivum]